jgi:hypothetical protein
LFGQSSSWANNGSMLNAQQSNAIANFDIGKLNSGSRIYFLPLL